MEDSGIDSGDCRPSCEGTTPLSPKRSIGGVPPSRIMQRKLGTKNRNQENKKSSGSLLPLQRLPVPGTRENQPLVAWDTDESEEEVVSFFPPPRRSPLRPSGAGAAAGAGAQGAAQGGAADPLDSLSVEELSLTDEEEDGGDLELVLPLTTAAPGPLPCCGPRFCCLL